ncbi:MAG: hypothetical protein II467_05250, partial [Bacilli bacterium]|nr:hypothetical protein [Bacilli bacterium]
MKHKTILVLSLLLPTVFSTGCGKESTSNSSSSESSSSAAPSSESASSESTSNEPLTYGFYTIKEGVTDLTFLQGYPWLNTSVVGVMDKIEKPAAKDDFFSSVNYETLQGITLAEDAQLGGGYYDRQMEKNKENVDALFESSTNEIARIKETIIKGAASEVKEEIETLLGISETEVREFFSSSKILEGVSKFIKVTHTTSHDEIGLSFDQNIHFGGLPFLVQLYSAGSTAGIKKDLEVVAEAIGINGDVKTAIAEAIDAMTSMFVNIKDADKKTAREATVSNIDQAFDGIFNVKSALKSLGCADDQKVLYTDYELALAKQFDALVSLGKFSTLAKILAVNKMADGRLLIGLENYKAKLADKLDTIGGVTGLSPEFGPKESDDDIARAFIERLYPEAIKR